MTFSHVKKQLNAHISCTLTDRAAANHAAIRIVNEVFGKSLIEVNCQYSNCVKFTCQNKKKCCLCELPNP